MNDNEDNIGIFPRNKLHREWCVCTVFLCRICNIAAAKHVDESAGKTLSRSHIKAVRCTKYEQALRWCFSLHLLLYRSHFFLKCSDCILCPLLTARQTAVKSKRLIERGNIIKGTDVNGDPCLTECPFKIRMKGHIGTDDEIRLQGKNLLQIRLMNDADLFGRGCCCLNLLRKCLGCRFPNDCICAACRDKQIQIGCVEAYDTLWMGRNGHLSPRAVRHSQFSRLRHLLFLRPEREYDRSNHAEYCKNDDDFTHTKPLSSPVLHTAESIAACVALQTPYPAQGCQRRKDYAPDRR